jgi:hypothetical protein
MKLHLFRQDLQDYQDFFGLVLLYPVHPVDPVRKIKLYFVKFFIRLNWPLFRPDAALLNDSARLKSLFRSIWPLRQPAAGLNLELLMVAKIAKILPLLRTTLFVSIFP